MTRRTVFMSVMMLVLSIVVSTISAQDKVIHLEINRVLVSDKFISCQMGGYLMTNTKAEVMIIGTDIDGQDFEYVPSDPYNLIKTNMCKVLEVRINGMRTDPEITEQAYILPTLPEDDYIPFEPTALDGRLIQDMDGTLTFDTNQPKETDPLFGLKTDNTGRCTEIQMGKNYIFRWDSCDSLKSRGAIMLTYEQPKTIGDADQTTIYMNGNHLVFSQEIVDISSSDYLKMGQFGLATGPGYTISEVSGNLTFKVKSGLWDTFGYCDGPRTITGMVVINLDTATFNYGNLSATLPNTCIFRN